MAWDLVALAETREGDDVAPPIRALEQVMRDPRPRLRGVVVRLGAHEITIGFIDDQRHPRVPREIRKLLDQRGWVGSARRIVRSDEDEGFRAPTGGGLKDGACCCWGRCEPGFWVQWEGEGFDPEYLKRHEHVEVLPGG